MTNFPKWNELRADIVESAGGEQAAAEGRHHNQAYIDEHRLAERRKAQDLSQTEVAKRMAVTKSRVSAVFGDDLDILRGTDATQAGHRA